MICTIELRPLALAGLQEAYNYYSRIRDELRESFLNELQLFLDKLERNPFICSFVKDAIRQGRLERFPYNVVYEVKENRVLVYSIFMPKQNPGKKRTS